jgi:hypothetical protein
MFIRMTANRLRLDDDAKHLVGALLVYMRNEFRVGVSAAEYHPPDVKCEGVWGAAGNYKKMMQCIDRILSRIDGTWDAQKLASAYAMIQRAIATADKGHIARYITNEVENFYGSLALESCWNRIAGEGDTDVPDGTRKAIDGSGDGRFSDDADNGTHEPD